MSTTTPANEKLWEQAWNKCAAVTTSTDLIVESILCWVTDAGCSLDSEKDENMAICSTLMKNRQHCVHIPNMALVNQQETVGVM